MTKVFRASRWDRSVWTRAVAATARPRLIGTDGQPEFVPPALDRARGRLPELPVHQGRVRRVLRRAGRGRIGDGARLRQGEVLRGVPSDRSDGASRARHAALRADEAGRPDRPAHRTVPVRRRAAAAGHPGRRSLQPRRLPDANQVGRSGPRAAHDARARAGRVRAVRHGAPQHLHLRTEGAAADMADADARRTCSLRGRSPVSRATWSRRRRVCWPAQRRRPGAGRGAAHAAAHDGNRRPGLLRLARRSGALSAEQHHARHHGAAAESAARQGP